MPIGCHLHRPIQGVQLAEQFLKVGKQRVGETRKFGFKRDSDDWSSLGGSLPPYLFNLFVNDLSKAILNG